MLIILGFKYQLGHAEFFSGAVYRAASWRKIDGTVNDIGPLCSNKSGERGGEEGRERESRWKIALDREFENRVPSKTTLIRLGARSLPMRSPKIMFAALHEIPIFRPIIDYTHNNDVFVRKIQFSL